MDESARYRWKRSLWVLIAAVAIPIIPFAVIGELPGERWLRASDTSSLAFAATGSALLAADTALPIPSSIIGTLLGARLGFWPGFASAFFGMWVGNLMAYGLGRLASARSDYTVPKPPALALVALSRPVPVLAEALAFAAGFERLGFAAFAAATGLGNACYAAAMAGSGAAFLPAGLAGPGLAVPMAVPVIGWLIWRRRGRGTASS